MVKSKNKNLAAAKKAKNDEFYTQLSDINDELKHYREHFKGKTILCNCDDPFESNFFRYFALNFNFLGLKKLIATSYVSSPVAGQKLQYREGKDGQMEICFDEENPSYKKPYKAIMRTFYDINGDTGENMKDIQQLFQTGENEISELKGDGDFRSEECIELLKEADIVCTNPPFSLFREYVAQLIKYEKKFIIVGNQNAITYKEVFPLLQNNKMWLGYGFRGNVGFFESPYKDVATSSKHIEGKIRISGVMWFTNLDTGKRHQKMILVKSYEEGIAKGMYPKYDNYDAIEVSKTRDIPYNWYGKMGVPITFMDKYNPEQFEIIGASNVNGAIDDIDIVGEKWISDYKQSGGTGHITANMHSLVGYEKNGKPVSYYKRIIIRNKHPRPYLIEREEDMWGEDLEII